MSCCGATPDHEEMDAVARLVVGRLGAFLGTLRDNGFAVGLAEGQDAAAVMIQGYADRPGLLRSAFKTPATNAPAGPARPYQSPKARSTGQ